MQLGRRHDFFFVGGADTPNDRTFHQVAWDDGGFATLEFLGGTRKFIQAKPRFTALVAVGSVTAVATVGQDGANLAVKVDQRFVGRMHAQR